MTAAPVHVTGLAAIAATGADTATFWRALRDGRSGLAPLSRFDSRGYPLSVAGEATAFIPEDQVEGRLMVQTDRWTQLALAAGERALADADLDPSTQDGYTLGVVTASATGGNEFGQVEIERLWRDGPDRVGPYQSIAWFYAASTGQLSIRHGLKGPCGVMVAEQAGGLDAIGQARRLVRRDAAAVLTGGTEAPVSPYAITCQLASGRLSPARDPHRAYQPFAAGAEGHVPGEGGAMLVLESAESVRARRPPRVYGTVAGYAARFAPSTVDGQGRTDGDTRVALNRAIRAALADAGAEPGDIDVVFADAAAMPILDAEEAGAIADTFGPGGVPVTAPKSLYGRVYSGGAVLDVVTALLSIRDGVIPPTGGPGPDPRHRLDLVVELRPTPIRAALVLARGHGGFTSAMVLRAPAPPLPHERSN